MKRLWTGLLLVTIFGFVAPGWVGAGIYSESPRIPGRVVTTEGQFVIGSGVFLFYAF